MVELSPPQKSDEQYPLLMVNGSGDGMRPQSPTVLSSVWNVSTGRSKWRDRWPEFLSACWMMVILLGISFLVFYVIGIIACRTQPFLIVKCNNSTAVNNVYYHQIVEHGNTIPFTLFSDYLASTAIQFPNLRFNVFFLIDDAFQSALTSRHSVFYSKLVPYHMFALNEEKKQELQLFEVKHPNVNITVMRLSTFMAMTPFKYKWRTIPLMNLPFYARIFSVWQNGGIGIDLMTYSNLYRNRQKTDRHLNAILKQHNDGIKADGYAKALEEIADHHDDINDFLGLVFNVFDQIMSDTRTFFNKTFPSYQITTENISTPVEPLVRTHRSKRDLSKQSFGSSNSSNLTTTQADISQEKTITANESSVKTTAVGDNTNANITENQTTQMSSMKMTEIGSTKILNTTKYAINANASEVPQAVFIYDLVFSSGGGSPFLFSDPISQSFFGNVAPYVAENKNKKPKSSVPNVFLTIDSEGLFVAATSRLHPFLAYIVSSGCRRMHPDLAIKDALVTKCSNFFRDNFCNNIYVI